MPDLPSEAGLAESIEQLAEHAKVLHESGAPHQKSLAAALTTVVDWVKAAQPLLGAASQGESFADIAKSIEAAPAPTELQAKVADLEEHMALMRQNLEAKIDELAAKDGKIAELEEANESLRKQLDEVANPAPPPTPAPDDVNTGPATSDSTSA